MYYMPPNNFPGLKRKDLNNESHVLDLFIEVRMYVKNRLYDRNRKIRSCTSFFKLDKTLLINGFIKETIKPIPIKEIT
jgi:hypothetical protein